jgi:hypothetical protein
MINLHATKIKAGFPPFSEAKGGIRDMILFCFLVPPSGGEYEPELFVSFSLNIYYICNIIQGG